MRIIGIVGLAGAGKTTVALRLNQKHRLSQCKFARALKLMLATLLEYRGCPADMIGRMTDGDLKEVPSHYLNGCTPRHAMQTLGTEWGRNCIDEDLWIDAESDNIAFIPRYFAGAVIDDVRFANEVAMIRAHGGEIWEVSRPESASPAVGDHVSERLRIEPDRRIVNADTVEHLNDLVDRMFHRFEREAA